MQLNTNILGIDPVAGLLNELWKLSPGFYVREHINNPTYMIICLPHNNTTVTIGITLKELKKKSLALYANEVFYKINEQIILQKL